MRGHNDLFAHTAIDVYAENLKAFTAIGSVLATGNAGATVEIGFYGTKIACFNTGDVISYSQNFHAEFVA